MKTVLLLSLLILLAAGGYYAGRLHHHAPAATGSANPATVYQCPMHPWIKSDQADAKCTICGMALVAALGTGNANAAAVDPNLVTLTSAQAAVTGVKTSEVRRAPLQRNLRVNGVIDDDDTRHRILAARVPGRIEKLHVNYVGAEVEAGAPLATIFSPEMLTAQRTYVERLKGGTAFTVSERSLARERLLELGLTEEEIRILEGTLQPTAMVNIRAPMSGTVVSRSVYEGQYVETNDPLFEIGDFSHMWFVFDAYEPDLPWIKPGQTVELTLSSLPGQVLTAPITFIDPNLDGATRTARVRVILDNTRRLLLHKQTAQAVVRTETPETLLVPRSAVLQHGGQPVVFLARDHEAYIARQIQLGRIGDTDAEVLSGLKEGDRVVTEGALLLDGQAQLAHAAVNVTDIADSGSSSPAPVSVALPAHDGDAHTLLKTLAFAAADGADALASDDLAGYQKHLPSLRAALDAYLAGFSPAARGPLAAFTGKLADGPDLDAARRAFEPFSTAVADAAEGEHLHHQEKLWIYECPMTPVLGTGRWLSKTRQLRNPFFGSAMLECGDEVN